MKVNAVGFDLDNTLLRFGVNVDWNSMRRSLVDYYLKSGVPVEFIAEYSRPLLLYARLYDTGKIHLSKERVLKIQEEASKIMEGYELQAVNKTSIIPGSIEVLKWLKERGIKIGIVTLQSEKSARRIFSKVDISGFADAIFYRDSPGRPKPYPDHIKDCIRELKCKTSETLFVGDNTTDMLAAREAGIYAVCVTVHEQYSEEELKKAGAKRLISNIGQLPSVIRELESK